MEFNKLFEDFWSYDEPPSENLYSIFNGPDLSPNGAPATLQYPTTPNEPLIVPEELQEPFVPSWSELPINQTPNNNSNNNKLFLPGLPSHDSQCPLVNKLEPLRCLFRDDWVRQCERKVRSSPTYDVVDLVTELIDLEKFCYKKPEELKSIMRHVLTKEERNKLIERRRKLLRKRSKKRQSPAPRITSPFRN